jgi:hypothetical protein
LGRCRGDWSVFGRGMTVVRIDGLMEMPPETRYVDRGGKSIRNARETSLWTTGRSPDNWLAAGPKRQSAPARPGRGLPSGSV